MLIRCVVFVIVFSLISACGDGSSGGDDIKDSLPAAVVFHDLSVYLTRNNKGNDVEFYRMQYLYGGGDRAWVSNDGIIVNNPSVDDENKLVFSSIKYMKSAHASGDISIKTKYKPSHKDQFNEDGPFDETDHVDITLHVSKDKIIKKQKDTFKYYADIGMLEKHDLVIPRFYKEGDELVINSKNSSLEGTYRKCTINFFDSFDLASVSPFSKETFDDVLIMSCNVYVKEDDIKIGYKIFYYAKDIGDIYRKTSFNGQVIHSLITDRKIYSY